MKKALLYGLSAVMLLSLTACGTAEAEPSDGPDPAHTTSAVQTEPPQETPAVTAAPDNVVEPLSANGGVKDAAGTELYTIFEQGYQGGQIYAEFGLSEDELILMELGEVESILSVRTDIKAPADLEAQYRAWRAETHPAAPVQAPTQTPAPAEAKPSTDGQQGNQNRTPQPGTGTGTTGTQTPPPGGGTEGIEPFDYESHKINLEDTKNYLDLGFTEESDPGDFIYGP